MSECIQCPRCDKVNVHSDFYLSTIKVGSGYCKYHKKEYQKATYLKGHLDKDRFKPVFKFKKIKHKMIYDDFGGAF